jgi:hypothetical protein
MPDKNQFAFALYVNKTDACAAVDALVLAGFRPNQISLRFPKDLEPGELSGRRRNRIQLAAAGAIVGTLVGAAIYGLTGFSPVTFHVIESSMSAGPVGGILASLIACGGFAGLIGSIDVIGRPKCIVGRYQNRVQSLGYFLSVECEEKSQKRTAEEILRLAGATDVSCTSELQVARS